MVVVESFYQLTSCVQSLAVNMPIIPHPVHCLVHILKMAAQEMTSLGSEDLLLDDKWLSSILGEEEQAVDKVYKEEELVADCDKDSVRSKRRRKEKRGVGGSAVPREAAPRVPQLRDRSHSFVWKVMSTAQVPCKHGR